MSATQDSTGPRRRGRTRITSRALDRVASRVAAEAFGVEQKQVSLEIEDARGDLSIRVKTPLRVPTLDEIHEEPQRVDGGGGPILERTGRAQEHIRQRVQTITGSTVSRVIVEITGADITPQRRVR